MSPLHLLLAAFAFLSISPLLAQEIRAVETVCKIYPDGSAGILQSWDVTVTSGTEWYIPIENLNGMEISDFHVYEGEEEREYLDEGRSWDSGRDLSQKAGRSGIVDKGSDGVELCWGLGSYGSHLWYITDAAGENGILEKDELKRWSRNHPDSLYYLLENNLTAEGRVWIREYGGKWNGEAFEDEPSRAEARKVVQFKNFLHDFTLVSERQTQEVELWKQYLIYAQLFGISKKVTANLRHLYPAEFEDFSRNAFNTKDFDLREVLAITSSFSAPVSASAKNTDSDSGSSRSSGGGGSSSYGGGGGYSGGGYGGGTR